MRTMESHKADATSKKSGPFFQKRGRNGLFQPGQTEGFFSNGPARSGVVQTKQSIGQPHSSTCSGSVQSKLTAGQPSDVYEKEADSDADHVARRASEPDSEGGLESSLRSSKGTGAPLSVATKEKME